MRLNQYEGSLNFGKAAYGFSTVSVMGAVPAPLVGISAGIWTGPPWLDADRIVYQACGGGACRIEAYNESLGTVATLDALGANFLIGGGGVWAAHLVGTGVRTNVGGFGPFPDATVMDASPDGRTVICNSYSTATGITIYDATGAEIFALPNVVLSNFNARLTLNTLSWQDQDGWHLIDITTNSTPFWYPRIDFVDMVVPVQLNNGQIILIERGDVLSIRRAESAKGFVLETLPVAFYPDAMGLTPPNIFRVGYCMNQGESTDSLKLIDVNVNSGAQDIGLVVGGAVVFTPGPTATQQVFEVGPAEGQSFAAGTIPPVEDPLPAPGAGGRMSLPWQGWAQSVARSLSALSGAVAGRMGPIAQLFGFGQIVVPGQTSIQATQQNDVLTLTSVDTSVAIVTDPMAKSVDLSVAGAAGLDAEFLVAAASPDLANERVVQDSSSIAWDFAVPGVAKANSRYYMSPLTTGGDPATAELVFGPTGDVVMVPIYW